jgi:hypothetical protein
MSRIVVSGQCQKVSFNCRQPPRPAATDRLSQFIPTCGPFGYRFNVAKSRHDTDRLRSGPNRWSDLYHLRALLNRNDWVNI